MGSVRESGGGTIFRPRCACLYFTVNSGDSHRAMHINDVVDINLNGLGIKAYGTHTGAYNGDVANATAMAYAMAYRVNSGSPSTELNPSYNTKSPIWYIFKYKLNAFSGMIDSSFSAGRQEENNGTNLGMYNPVVERITNEALSVGRNASNYSSPTKLESNPSLVFSGGKIYIGPLKATHGGGTTKLTVEANGQTYTSAAYQKNGDSFNEVSKAPSGGEFYAAVDENVLAEKYKVNFQGTINTYRARVLFASNYHGGYTSQNKIYFYADHGEAIGGTISWEIDGIGNLTIRKTDVDNDKLTFSGVKFLVTSENGDFKGKYLVIKGYEGKELSGTDIDGFLTNISYTTDKSKATVFVTNNSGVVTIKKLLAGKYRVYEIYNPYYGYLLDAQDAYKIGVIAKVAGDITFNVANEKQTGTLRLVKEDPDSGARLDGVEFTIKASNGKYIRINNLDVIRGAKVVTRLDYVDREKATTFITGSGVTAGIEKHPYSGMVKLVNILIDTYTVEEISVGNKYYGYELDGNYIWWKSDTESGKQNTMKITVTRQSSTETEFEGTSKYSTLVTYNRQKYIKISGCVWEDLKFGKEGANDYLYNQGEETLLNGIPVKLIDGRTNKVVMSGITSTVNGTAGSYLFVDVLLDELEYYYLQFEYDGYVYTTVKSFNELGYSNVSAPDNSSKALEVEQDRQKLDDSYQDVTGKKSTDASRNSSGTESYGTVDNANIDLKYDTNSSSGEAVSTYTISKKDQSDANSVKVSRNYDQHKVLATTHETGYNAQGGETKESIRAKTENYTELKNRNCGLIEREQTNLSVSTDVDNVIVKINGYTNTYRYEKVNDYSNINDFRLAVKVKKQSGYERELYRSDLVRDNGEDTTQIWITYKMTVRNNSDTVAASVTELANYYDSRYKIEATGTTKDLTGDIAWKDTNKYGTIYGKDSNGYMCSYTDSLKNKKILAGHTQEIYVKYKLSNQAAISVLSQDITLNNVIEIDGFNSYYGEKTYYHTGEGTRKDKLYSSVDSNSAPGNAKLGDVSTYEDDTAIAPAITMKLTENERTLQGTVFEDAQTQESKAENERLGDGEYKEKDDSTVAGVQVDLLLYKNREAGEVATLYKYENGKRVTSKATYITGEDGSYEFAGIVPDEYILKFTYADGNVVYKNGKIQSENIDVTYYKSTIIKSNIIKEALNNNKIVGNGSRENKVITGTNYDSNKWFLINENDTRYSDAIDTNELVEAALELHDIKNADYDGTKYKDATYKEAYTGAMNVQVEYSANETANVARDTSTSTQLIENSDGTYKVVEVLSDVTKNVDFGVAQKAKQSYDINKDVSKIKLTLANGQVLIDGNPKESLSYVKYLDKTSPRTTTVNLEIDNEILYGSTLDVTYKITATNNSETNYLTADYYRYGGTKENIETVQMSKIIDYLDNDLVYLPSDDSRINKLKKENYATLKDYLSDEVYKDISKYNTIIILEGKKALVPYKYNADDGIEIWEYQVNKLLSTADDLNFTNDVEEIEKHTTKTPSEESTPGNNNPTDDSSKTEGEQDNYQSEITITGPTGEDRSYIKYIIGIAGLTVLAGGIIIIKRKVL